MTISIVGNESPYQRILRLVNAVDVPPYQFNVRSTGDDDIFVIQAVLWRQDTDDPNGPWDWGYGGEQMVRKSYTDDAIIKRCFVAARDYSEHEVREAFLYEGKRIFDPHMPVSTLWQAATRG